MKIDNMMYKNEAGVLFTFVYITIVISHITAKDWKPVLQGQYANDLRECRAKWPKISNNAREVSSCMEKLVYAIGPRFRDPEGIPPIGTPIFDPVVMDHVVLADSPVLQGNLTDVRIYNGSLYLRPGTCSISYDPATKIATMVTKGDVAVGVGEYSLRLNLGALLNNDDGSASADSGTISTGKIRMVATNPRQDVRLHMRETKSGKGLTVARVESNPTFEKMDIEFTPFRQDDALGNLLNTMITGETAAQLTNDFVAPANRITSLGIGSLFHKGWWKLEEL